MFLNLIRFISICIILCSSHLSNAASNDLPSSHTTSSWRTLKNPAKDLANNFSAITYNLIGPAKSYYHSLTPDQQAVLTIGFF
ncbi:MAG: hypothetical protein WBQ73_00460 [Candidatus Babeliales bacterium]